MRTVAPPRGRQNRTIVLAIAVVLVVLAVRACFPGANQYEKIAAAFTGAVQRDDMAAVQKMENVNTAADMSRGRLGSASDALAPLGAIKRVKEVPATGDTPRTHEFDLTFEKGTVHERMQLDPQNKIVHFHYDPPVVSVK